MKTASKIEAAFKTAQQTIKLNSIIDNPPGAK